MLEYFVCLIALFNNKVTEWSGMPLLGQPSFCKRVMASQVGKAPETTTVKVVEGNTLEDMGG